MDRKELARTLAGAVALLVLAGLGSQVWGPMATIMRYSVADHCAAVARADCVADLSATVTSTWDDRGEGEPYTTLLSLDVPRAAPGALRNPYDGSIQTEITLDEAKRLRLVESDTETEVVDQIAVTMIDGEVVAVTSMGETVATRWAPMPGLAVGQFLLTLLVVAGLAAGAAALWWRGRRSWLGPAVGTAVTGAVVGLLATIVTSGHVTAGWTLPILGITLLAGIPVALLSAREPNSVRENVSAQ